MYATIRDWIIAVTGYGPEAVYREHQEGPRGDVDHATYKIITSSTDLHAIETREDYGEDDDVLRTFSHLNRFYVSINIYASDGYDIIDGLSNSNEDYHNRQILTNGAGLELVGLRNESQDLTSLGDTKHKPRYQGTFEFRRYRENYERNQRILEISIQGTIDGDDDTAHYPPP